MTNLKRVLVINTAPAYTELFEAVKLRFERMHNDVQFLIANDLNSGIALRWSLDFVVVFLLVQVDSREKLVATQRALKTPKTRY